MEHKSSISYVIPAYNCADTLKESVESIMDGNFQEGDEIIIVDDASTDNTSKIINELMQKYPFIIALKHNYNKGSAAAGRNTAIDQAKNELIFCLDADNILAPNSVHLLKEFLISKNAESCSFGELHFFKDDINQISQKWIFKNEYTLFEGLNEPRFPGSSGNYLLTKKSWLKAGRYNESVGGAYDSWAFGIAQLATGSKMITMPNSFYYHRSGHDSAFIRDEKKYNPSLIALQVIIPYIDLINEDDINYIMSPEYRYQWFQNISSHPIRIKNDTKYIADKTIIFRNNIKKPMVSRIYKKIKKILNG